jgi:hypothetical protein
LEKDQKHFYESLDYDALSLLLGPHVMAYIESLPEEELDLLATGDSAAMARFRAAEQVWLGDA